MRQGIWLNYVGTEHLLLSLIREGKEAARILKDSGLTCTMYVNRLSSC